jgi:hypothetical protein
MDYSPTRVEIRGKTLQIQICFPKGVCFALMSCLILLLGDLHKVALIIASLQCAFHTSSCARFPYPAVLLGGDRKISLPQSSSSEVALVLDASTSFDPDDADAALSFTWC